ncbi:Asp-tRNA(Asn)/Glu-tRNA(Gln) amidotransferase subunit GatB [Wolbachia endosymbiont of Cruorifilaria tuberocauda]|uniref:Asp-tRNA(Asn)/Glu-tRNA(Gln) amidotransferase subunit GatB n=1 Tax=Wolbachia endosymbiont of Cruorifilaria tuberocauda TaxID=1812111 RepID=UPI00158F4A69|nr:Asp-tRNA(Asn)/Glu-tRNA(Gln) amidotransferase subunit GatB [Wolbachia endosymbiont of Cruorifilaria tuberocauda]QKX01740.1 Asp-tRNA(Asn)/Glu-tRNA(Gln) amidotransferase subunit GatB [Wolbachia endosymbiont of Cruorifilaria tuberocauda]
MTKENWEAVIGLEVHARVSSKAKLFSSSSAKFGAEHNTQVSLIDAAMPGTLPVLNYYSVEQAIRTGLALSAEINKCSHFDRKNYFYPDLPQGYQITQFFEPIVKNGRVFIDNNKKGIRIARIHLEQDAGKSIHGESKTYVDLNRAGIALMEIVSEPDLRSSIEAAEFMKKLRQILRYVGSCDGDMENGSLRCDANVSVRLKGRSTFGTRCEIKNLNSIRYIVQAIDCEVQRQIEILENGGEVIQDTLLFDVALGKTEVMRNKEDTGDYRYFPEPDLLPVKVSQDRIDLIKSSLPELPDQKKLRYINEFGINECDADVIISDKAIADYFEELIKKHDSKLVVTWLTVELLGRLNKAGIDIVHSPIKANDLSRLLDFIVDGTISAKLGKHIFDIMFKTGKSASLIIEEHGLRQITDKNQISEVVDKVVNDNQDKVQEYKSGKIKLYRFLIGEVMRLTKGKANPDVVNSILRKRLSN